MKRNTRWFKGAVLLCGATLLSGCYTYSDVGLPQVPLGVDVRAQVTNAVADSVAPLLGYRSTTLEGTVLRRGPQGLLLRVPGKTVPTGTGVQRYYQRISLTPTEVLDLQTRRLNTGRTLALVAVGAAAVIYFVAQAFSGSNGGSTTPPPPVQRAHRVPIN